MLSIGRVDEDAEAEGEDGRIHCHDRTTERVEEERTMIRFWYAVAIKVVPGEKETVDAW